tara:strand:+ start:74 stop:307 length:234 start_codon:yes stop_codon:yes gene_type:complete
MGMAKRKYDMKEMNYDRPTNRLVVPKRAGKTSPKNNRDGFPSKLDRQLETKRKYGEYVSLFGKTLENLFDGKKEEEK